ncbi:hypothetical protein [Euzebya sp.]|uniref:hypothetical protein n=1 Tax=Euzebya sp. TaxID=1971409 RepID=UPI0035113B37
MTTTAGPAAALDPRTRAEVERWLTRRGLPHLIAGYSAREDVLTRVVPFLALVFTFEVLLALNLDWPLWANVAAVVGGGVLLLGAYGLLNRLQGRATLALPRRVGNGEIATFLMLPALLPVVFGGDLASAAVAILGNAVTLAVVYFVASYGILHMLRWALAQTGRHLAAVGRLAARALPMLLLFSTFLFVNAELWQVAGDFTTATFTATIVLFVGAGLIFFLLRLPRQTADIATFDTWAQVEGLIARSPAVALGDAPSRPLADVPPLSRPDRLNVGLLLVVAQGVQILLVSALIGAFFVAFGLIAIREGTILTWTTAEEVTALARLTLWDTPVVLTTELVRVASFIAAFTGLQFTVSASTDETWRAEFIDDVVADVREALAVRARCLAAAPPDAG